MNQTTIYLHNGSVGIHEIQIWNVVAQRHSIAFHLVKLAYHPAAVSDKVTLIVRSAERSDVPIRGPT
jgi:hypothetical protein